MTTPILHTLIMAGIYLVLFGSAELLYHKAKWSGEHTRKYTHIVSGILALTFPYFIDDLLMVGLLCASFLVILFVSEKTNTLPSIHHVDRHTYGGILFPIAVFGCYALTDFEDNVVYYYAPLLILAISDPLAAFVGRKHPLKKYTTMGRTKSFGGSGAFFISALIISLLCLHFAPNLDINVVQWILFSVLIALMTAVVEAFGHKGWDNLTIPVVANAILWLWIAN